MKLDISKEAASWYKKELDIEEPTNLRFFVRYGGFSGNVPGFSLGVAIDTPENKHASNLLDEITFFIEETDVWYFENSNLQITMDKGLSEPEFKYV